MAAIVRCPLRHAAVGALLFVQIISLAYCATVQSPTMLEPAQLAAGVATWRLGRFDLFRVNPPLVRMVAALPVLAAGCETDWGRYQAGLGARSEFVVGQDFVKANGKRTLWLCTIARWACIPFSLIGSIACFLWARELYGLCAGFVALTVWIFDPNIIGHGALIANDVPATALGVASGYLFWRWLRKPTWMRAAHAGIGLGLAQLSKLSWIILFGLWPLLWLFWFVACRCCPAAQRSDQPRVLYNHNHGWTDSSFPSRTEFARQLLQLFCMITLSLFLLNLCYCFDESFLPLSQFTFCSKVLSGTDIGGNLFTDSWIGSVLMPLPKQFILGADAQQVDFEGFNAASYLSGEWRNGGWWYYYLYCLFVKVPHGTQLLIGIALFVLSCLP